MLKIPIDFYITHPDWDQLSYPYYGRIHYLNLCYHIENIEMGTEPNPGSHHTHTQFYRIRFESDHYETLFRLRYSNIILPES